MVLGDADGTVVSTANAGVARVPTAGGGLSCTDHSPTPGAQHSCSWTRLRSSTETRSVGFVNTGSDMGRCDAGGEGTDEKAPVGTPLGGLGGCG